MSGGERIRDSDIVYLLLQEVLRHHLIQISIVIAYVGKLTSNKRKCIRLCRKPSYGSKCLRPAVSYSKGYGGGLVDGNYVVVEEQVAIFVSVLAHHKKNRVVGFDFRWSGQTISHYVHAVLGAVLRLHDIFLAKPEAVSDDCTDGRWQWFKGCLGALDGTYANVLVSKTDTPRYRTRKGEISTNVLAVCDRDLQFVYALSGWEGSASDSRILRDSLARPHGLKVPKGKYYLCDNGYANSEGFLTPFKGLRYHLKEWGPTAA
ncbi:uncharacterized protein LOC131005117 [Salvia miltiorrhiza]|uniref:uncharacterized protein LOC131005117 n=1 Tax=Salvia miltiorrhiza TaxID=226208 RepID=UPI0025AC82A8|nr:uncharacterized protein LOC131005117 [Salvia miltiorrhiza]